MTLVTPDPFTVAYNALWAILEASEDFCTLVPTNNRIKFTGIRRDPLKESVQAADLPEVRIIGAGGSCNTHAASNAVRVSKRFQIQVSSGDQLLDAALFPVEWEILRAFIPAHWQAVVATLTWNGYTAGTAGGWGIDLVDITDNQEGVSDADLNRGIRGWSTAWACEVRLWFAASVIKPTTETEGEGT